VKRMRPLLTTSILVVIAAAVASCGGAGDPLGGPYGGTGAVPAPTDNDQQPSGGEDAGQVPSSNPGNGNSDPGTGAPTDGGHDSGTSGGNDSGGHTPPPDAGGPPPPVDSGSQTTAPTWSTVFAAYLESGTIGNCGHCHSEMDTATKAYSWLQGKHQLPGPNPGLTSTSNSYLTWYGGNMPPGGSSSEPAAVAQMNAWAAAGALNN
jgi:hypothetical protein